MRFWTDGKGSLVLFLSRIGSVDCKRGTDYGITVPTSHMVGLEYMLESGQWQYDKMTSKKKRLFTSVSSLECPYYMTGSDHFGNNRLRSVVSRIYFRDHARDY